jgi:hypothetical protein
VVGHLHGTELLMLGAIAADPGRWAHAAGWAHRMREWAVACERVIVLHRPRSLAPWSFSGSIPDWFPTAMTRGLRTRGISTTTRTGAAPRRGAARMGAGRRRGVLHARRPRRLRSAEGETPALL